jgi:HEAT repeat protein
MKARNLCVVVLFFLIPAVGRASATETVPLAQVTAPWMGLLRSRDAAVRNAAGTALVRIVRKYPAAASALVHRTAGEGDGTVLAEHERRLVPLAKESPATVSALIRLIRDKDTNYRARNFGVKVLSQVGPAAATPEFVDALAETYCPVPGSFLRVMRGLGKDATPILAAGFRHPNANVRKWATIGLRVIGRTEPAIQKLFAGLQAEPLLFQKLREGAPADRVAAVGALAELARTTPGTGTALVNALKGVTDKAILAEAEGRLKALGRESPEVVAALVAGVRTGDEYYLRRLAIRVLPKVGTTLNCKEMVEALGDDDCPVPGAMRRILIAAGPDALPVLAVARKHANPEIRKAAESILQRMSKPAAAASASPRP